ncbi:MAG TPA: DNA-directed RNA polymerase subunit alpha C-terminal domain-containing protein, partial [Candidatus Saccharimonadales bacterium]|nr:DNA-directed RNA polymerase subunit alpha C-terminal domain-containing protein [Candidatus Saccharimonadales bacterium]
RKRVASTPIAMIRANQEEEVLSLLRDPSLATAIEIASERLGSSRPKVDSATLLNFGLEELELGVRAYNVLYRCGVRSVGDVVGATEDELSRLPNFGRLCIEEVKNRLAEHGLHLSELGTRTARPGWLERWPKTP